MAAVHSQKSISGQKAVSSLPAVSLQHIIGHPNLTMVKRYIAFTQDHIKEQEGQSPVKKLT